MNLFPTRKGDFLWHSHMQNHEAYKRDMKELFGRVLNHVDDF